MENNIYDEFLDDDDVIDEVEEEEESKPGVFRRIIGWIRKHGTTILIAVIPAVIKALLARREYDNYIYTTDSEGKVYKLPAKEMRTIKSRKNVNVSAEMAED